MWIGTSVALVVAGSSLRRIVVFSRRHVTVTISLEASCAFRADAPACIRPDGSHVEQSDAQALAAS